MKDFTNINMNGRMYDPALGTMLSADNFVQNPEYSQSYNRYSYCFNNPLKYIDPSGYYAGWDPELPPWSISKQGEGGLSPDPQYYNPMSSLPATSVSGGGGGYEGFMSSSSYSGSSSSYSGNYNWAQGWSSPYIGNSSSNSSGYGSGSSNGGSGGSGSSYAYHSYNIGGGWSSPVSQPPNPNVINNAMNNANLGGDPPKKKNPNSFGGMGFGVEGTVFGYNLTTGYLTSGKDGGFYFTLNGSISWNFGWALDLSVVQNKNPKRDFKVSDIKGTGSETTWGYGVISFSITQNGKFSNQEPYYKVYTLGIGPSYLPTKVSGGINYGNTWVVPSLPVFMPIDGINR